MFEETILPRMKRRERKNIEKEIEDTQPQWSFGSTIITPLILAKERCVEYIKGRNPNAPIEE